MTAPVTDQGKAPRLSPVLRRGLVRLGLYLALMLALTGLVLVLPQTGLGLSLSLLCGLGLAATLWLLLPLPGMILIAPGLVAALVVALDVSNRQKIALTQFPVTPTDLVMLATTPTGVLVSVGAPNWAYGALYAVPTLALLGLLLLSVPRLARLGPRQSLVAAAVLGLSALAAGGALWGLYQATLRTTSAYLRAHQDRLEVWEPAGISALSQELGVLGFLAYAQDIESADRDLFLTYVPDAAPPSRPQILAAADVYVRQEAMTAGPPPNIVILHAESTFDPNLVFRLDRQVDNPLFPSSPDRLRSGSTQLTVPALVNTVGGGSWMSEFEVITGIDARLFGVAGRFTHSSLSPSAAATFPRYLDALGYQLAAYIYADGAFYNYRRGYLNYGFQEFYDIDFFDVPSNDLQIAETAMTTGTVDPEAPFLKMILLNDNHSPHDCTPARADRYQPVAFLDAATEEMTCALQEYLWRSQRVAETADAIEARLIALRQATGRDYVLAIYGDHQPYSFTGGGSVMHNMGLDFTAQRQDAEKRLTLVQIRSSRANPLNCCGTAALPLTLLPTLISAYVAPSLDRLYLPETLYMFDYCGSDWIGRLISSSFYGSDDEPQAGLCPAFPETLAALQASGVMRTARTTEDPAATLVCRDSAGDLVIDVTASGTRFGDPPEFAVLLDDVEIGRASVVGAIDTTTAAADPVAVLSQPQTFRFKVRPDRLPQSVAVDFLNDRWAGDGLPGDTNLWLLSVRVGQTVLNGSDLIPRDAAAPPGDPMGAWYLYARRGGLIGRLPPDPCG